MDGSCTIEQAIPAVVQPVEQVRRGVSSDSPRYISSEEESTPKK